MLQYSPSLFAVVMGDSMSLLDAKPVYKPFQYPWAYEAWMTQQRVHWLPEEVPLADDVKDWQKKLTPGEKNLLTADRAQHQQQGTGRCRQPRTSGWHDEAQRHQL